MAAGSYVGTNLYGVSRWIFKSTRIDDSIFERDADYTSHLLKAVGPEAGTDPVIDRIPMSAPAAQAVKAPGKAVVIFMPKWPFYADSFRGGEGRLDTQEDVDHVNRVIVANIQCVALVSQANQVQGTYETN